MIPVSRCLCGMMLALLLTTAARAETDAEVRRLHDQGKAAFGKQDYDAAIAACEKALRLDPKDYEGYINRGSCYRIKHDFERAIADYGKAIRLLGEDSRTYDGRSFAGSLSSYSKAIYLRRLLANTYAARGEVFAEQHDLERAIADLTKAITLEPRNCRFYCYRAFLNGKRKDYSRAMTDCNYLVQLAADQANSYCWRGTLYAHLGDHEHALADLNEAIRRNPKSTTALYARGSVYLAQKDYARAITNFEETVRLDSQHSQACFALAELYFLCPQAGLRNQQKALLYAKKGCGVAVRKAQDGYEMKTRHFAFPIKCNSKRREDIEKISLFVSEDKGKNWKHEKDYKSSEERIFFLAPHDGLYWFALQTVSRDGQSNPSKLDYLVPSMKVYVNSEGKKINCPNSGEEPQNEVEQLRTTVQQLEKKIKELESDRKPK